MSSPKVSVIYYSSTGTGEKFARAVEAGAKAAGAEVRVRLVEETAPDAAIDGNPAWRAFVDAHRDAPRATHDDVTWADAVVFGSPTRFGNVAAQLKAFLDSMGGLWFSGALQDKIYSGFTSAKTVHGGHESTLLALYHSFYHFGGYVVTPGYTSPIVEEAGGNPYGPSAAAGSGEPNEAQLKHAEYLGQRVTEVARKFVG